MIEPEPIQDNQHQLQTNTIGNGSGALLAGTSDRVLISGFEHNHSDLVQDKASVGLPSSRSGKRGSMICWLKGLLFSRPITKSPIVGDIKETQMHSSRIGFTDEKDRQHGDTASIQDYKNSIREDEKALLSGAVRIRQTKVEDVMVPRADVVSVPSSLTLIDLFHQLSRSTHSRLPVYDESLDNPIGIIHVRDALNWIVDNGMIRGDTTVRKQTARRCLENGSVASGKVSEQEDGAAAQPDLDVDSGSGPISNADDRVSNNGARALIKKVKSSTIGQSPLLRPVLYAPPSMSVMDLLHRMRVSQTHMALVVDEFGGTDGLVTIEDIIEELVGEIQDEHDDSVEVGVKADASGLVAEGRAPIEDVERALGIDLGSGSDELEYETIGGLLVTWLGHVPAAGEQVHHPSGAIFRVIKADARRVLSVHVRGQ